MYKVRSGHSLTCKPLISSQRKKSHPENKSEPSQGHCPNSSLWTSGLWAQEVRGQRSSGSCSECYLEGLFPAPEPLPLPSKELA